MNQPLFDRPAILRARRRATDDGMFLQRLALDEVQERLTEVNRTFNSTAIVSAFPDIWREAFPNATFVSDDDTLNLSVGQFDLVIHAMCLHSANDPLGQIIQCHHALMPDGLFMAACFGGDTLRSTREMVMNAESYVSGGAHPRFHPMADIRDWGGLLQRAGLALPVCDRLLQSVQYSTLSKLMLDLRHMGEGMAMTQRAKTFTRRAVFDHAETLWNEAPVLFEMIFLAGWAPHENQQKPLRPGSANTHLSQVLGKLTTDD